ncbi:TIGR03084 family metal-binding protein [Saccharopolyspora sp. NPDC000359]|uniref:TIGR03084 family metal-binding protein n=1 Tax=Saccharopolyspora sp. NPDC000359 TaxID=3154251 RepID=UPI00332FD8F4
MPEKPVLADLRVESAELDAVVSGLGAAQWALPTPAEGWTIAHQIAHLAWTDAQAHRAVTDPDGFREELRTAEVPLGEAVDNGAAEGARLAPQDLLERWRAGRADLQRALVAAPENVRVPWFGPPMKIPSMATARIMETWAHGQDVVDALGVRREPTARLRHVAHLGVRTLGFAFALHGLPAPTAPVRVELNAPDGQLWTWGPPEAPDRVTGTALDFCLLVTQRRHRDDLAVTATGSTAEQWLPIAQAFAGDPGPGRQPGRRS